MSSSLPLNPRVQDRSRPVLRQPVELATHLGLKVYNRSFPRTEAALFLADVVAHLQGRASRDYAQEIEQVNEAISRELDRLEALMTGETRRLGNVLKKSPSAAGLETGQVSYTHPAQVELTLRTPRACRYAALLGELERASRTLDTAWYAGSIATPARFDLENRLFRNFMRSCGVFERLARGLARRVRDDAELPSYRAMLVKRTGRGPEAAPAPAVDDEGREEMTAGEVASLQATEGLAAAWIGASPIGGDDTAAKPDAGTDDPPDGGAGAGPVEAVLPPEPAPAARAVRDDLALAEAGRGPADDGGTIEADPTPGDGAAETIEPRRRRVRDLVRGTGVEA